MTEQRIANHVAEKMCGLVHFHLTVTHGFAANLSGSRPACMPRPSCIEDWPRTTIDIADVTCPSCIREVQLIERNARQ